MRFQELPVDLSTPLHVAKGHLQVSVIEEDAFLLALGNDPSKDTAGTTETLLTLL